MHIDTKIIYGNFRYNTTSIKKVILLYAAVVRTDVFCKKCCTL